MIFYNTNLIATITLTAANLQDYQHLLLSVSGLSPLH